MELNFPIDVLNVFSQDVWCKVFRFTHKYSLTYIGTHAHGWPLMNG